MFNQFVDVYTNEDGEENEKYEYHVQGLSDNIIETVATANKGKKSAAKKQVLSKQRVHELLSKHRLDSAVRHLLHFVQSMETTVI